MKSTRVWALAGGPMVAAGLGLGLRYGAGLEAGPCWVAAVAALCAVWWVAEPIAIPATSIIPFAVFPLVGVLDADEVSHAYGHHLVLLFLGGFLLSRAMERSGAHRRVALGMVRLVGGTGGPRMVLAFLLASALLSMWISNTATALMLLPVVLAVVERTDEERMAVPLLLAMAYGANIGGMGTPIGTPPNVVFMAGYERATGREISFLEWMGIGVPVVVCLLPIAWLWLSRPLWRSRAAARESGGGAPGGPAVEGPGPWRAAEVRVLIVFTLTALLWVFRSAPAGGWSGLIGTDGAGDSTVALLAAVVLFLVPDGRGGRLLDWETAKTIPWGILLLFAGGIALAEGFVASGLSETAGEAMRPLAELHPLVMIGAACLAVTFLTEVTSNTATANVLMPLLASAAVAASIEPKLLMIPAVLSASCAFMLPVATPPNAIAFGADQLTVRAMAREGLAMNLAGACVVSVLCYLLV